MHVAGQHPEEGTGKVIASIQEMRQFSGPPEDFWRQFIQGTCALVMARQAVLFAVRDAGGPYEAMMAWPEIGPLQNLSGGAGVGTGANAGAGAGAGAGGHFRERAAQAAAQAPVGGVSIEPGVPGGPGGPPIATTCGLIALGLDVGPAQRPAALVLALDPLPHEALEPAALLLRLIADVPAAYQKERALRRASTDVVKLTEALDLMILLNDDVRWMKAALTFTGELAARIGCSRVSLGWLDGDYVRLQAMSHVENFEERTTAVAALEACMEEALDQDEEVVWPRPEGSDAVTKGHEDYARKYACGNVVSLPLRLDDSAVAVVTCERADPAFAQEEIETLRLLCDQATRRLADLRSRDRWIGARLAASAREKLAWVLGVEHTFAKLLGLVICALVGFAVLGTWDYRVEGSFLLKTDDLIFLPAPFEGYIDDVEVRVGDPVKKGDLLLALDTRDLVLDESAALAEMSRQSREAEKARAKNDLASMRIAQALVAEGQVRLAKVRYHLSAARVCAPMDGLIVEGDLKKMLGAPVRKGDVLFKIARIDRMYAEVDVDEKDVHEVHEGSPGEIAFVSRPSTGFKVAVARVDPIAVSREGRNVFTVRATLSGPPADWFRPGMSGVAKIDVGRRNILWILTHRTIEYLRLALWI